MDAVMLIRRALPDDAGQLSVLNTEFNGAGGPSPDIIRESLRANTQEEVFVAEENGVLTGFLCVQLKRSFCYADVFPEITELYVRTEYRNRGTASSLMKFAEKTCLSEYPMHRFELLTGDDNLRARALYESLGYTQDGEIHLTKTQRSDGGYRSKCLSDIIKSTEEIKIYSS